MSHLPTDGRTVESRAVFCLSKIRNTVNCYENWGSKLSLQPRRWSFCRSWWLMLLDKLGKDWQCVKNSLIDCKVPLLLFLCFLKFAVNWQQWRTAGNPQALCLWNPLLLCWHVALSSRGFRYWSLRSTAGTGPVFLLHYKYSFSMWNAQRILLLMKTKYQTRMTVWASTTVP